MCHGRSTRQRTLEHYHRVWAATGSDVSVEQDPLLAQLLDDCPIPTLGGFPCLTPWLSWSDQCKVFVLGAYAALTLGADAFNLMGARMGSSRVGYVLDAMLDESADDKEGLYIETTLKYDAKPADCLMASLWLYVCVAWS